MTLLSGFLCISVALGVAGQADLQPVVEQALDEPVDLAIENAPLEQAFRTIGEKTGVTITMPPGTVELLPYGPATQVTAKLQKITLREGLGQLLAPLGMTYQATPRGVEVYPSPGLARIGRRATWPELKTLQWLQTTRFVGDAASLEVLRQRMQFHVEGAKPWEALAAAVQKTGAGPGTEVLEVATRSLGWTWYPAGEQIAVLSLAEQTKRQLGAVVSVRQSHRAFTDVLRDLGRQAGIAIRLGAGVADALPVQVRKNFSLLADNVTAGEALEEIAGLTGLKYRADAEGVVFELPSSGAGGTAAALTAGQPVTQPRDPYVAKITVPDPSGAYQIEFVLRESDLSPQVNELRKALLKDSNQVLEEALKKRLATQPSAK